MATIPLIHDGERLEGAASEFGRSIPIYDDGFGPLWVLCDSMGVTGVIRAQSFEDAHSIAEDEMYPEADEPTWEAMAKECDYSGPTDGLMDNAIFQESYGFRPNGRNATDKHGHGIYQKDLNGDLLEPLTASLASALRISLAISSEAES